MCAMFLLECKIIVVVVKITRIYLKDNLGLCHGNNYKNSETCHELDFLCAFY